MAQDRSARSTTTLERLYDATLEEVWEMWTTTQGVEAWWGPEGFDVKVRQMDLRAGGNMTYVMTATAPDQIEFMRQAGMPVATEARLTFIEVEPPRLLAYNQVVDFVPGIEPYEVATRVDLVDMEDGVRLSLTLEAMHDREWTDRAVAGWESELNKLASALRASASDLPTPGVMDGGE